MTFTIEELEALKEGIPPGSWEFVECSENQYGDLEESRLVTSDGEDIAYDVDDSFGKLFAAAPELVDALIAEKQAHAELRKRIEERIRELKQPLCSHMPEGDELDDYLEQWDRQSYEAAVLTEILEGNA